MPIDLNALTAQQKATMLFVVFMDRAPAPAGLQFWTEQFEAGLSLSDAASIFASSPEATGNFPYLAVPGVASAASFVNKIFQNFFGRDPLPEGLAYWTGVLSSGTVAPAEFVLIAASAASDGTPAEEGGTPGPNDAETLLNKIEAATSFAQSAAEAGVLSYADNAAAASQAASILDGVTSDDATVTAAATTTSAFFGESGGGGSTTGQTLVLTDSADNLSGTAGNDVFVGANDNGQPSVAAGDVVTGGAGTDRINLFGDENVAGLGNISMTSVEQVFAQFSGTAGADKLNVSGFTDITQAWVSKGTLNAADGVDLTKAQTLGIEGKIAATNLADTLTATFTDATAGTADTASVALNNADMTAFTKGLVIDAIETLNVSATGSNKLGTLDSDSVSTLAVTGAGSLSMTADNGGSTFKTVTAGDGGLTLDLHSINAAQDHTITTGAGADTITNLWARQTKADKIDLGDGNDKLVFTDAVTVTNATEQEKLSGVSNVEELAVNGAAALTLDGDLVTQTLFEVDGTGNFALTDIKTDSTLTFGDADTATTSSVAMKLGSSSLNINLEGGSGAASVADDLVTITGASTINIASSGSAGVAKNQLNLSSGDNSNIFVTGSQDLQLTTAAGTGTTGFTIDGSAFTGKLEATGTAASDTVIGGSGADTLSGGTGAANEVQTITVGASGGTANPANDTVSVTILGTTVTTAAVDLTEANDVATAIKTAIDGNAGLAAITDVSVATNVVTVTYNGAQAGNDVDELTVNNDADGGDGTVALAIATTTVGGTATGHADTFTGNGGNDTFNVASGDPATDAGADTVTDFVSGADKLEFGAAAGSSTNYSEAGAAVANYAAALAAAQTALDGAILYNAQQVGSDTFVFYDADGTDGGEQVVKLQGVGLDGIAFADIA